MISKLFVYALASLPFAVGMPTVDFDLSKRQGGDGTVGGCTESGCTDCPTAFVVGDGWPNCLIYDTTELRDDGYPVEDNGQMTLFFDVPPLDPGCQVLIRTPVVATENDCGGNVLIAQGATCAPVRVDNTFITLFCCGVEDCSAAGAPTRRDVSQNPARFSSLGGGASFMKIVDRNGNVREPHVPTSTDVNIEKSSLSKRDCGNFRPTSGLYSRSGGNNIVSDTVTCGQTQGCSATLGSSVTETFSISTSVSVGDPFGIVSASIEATWEKSVERSFEGTFDFGPGERGYVIFVPILTCVKGVFEGDCEGNGQEVEACGPSSSGGAMTGDLRAVLIRG